LRFLSLFISSLLFLAGCSLNDAAETPTVSIQTLSLSPNKLTITELNTEFSLTLIATDANENAVNLSNGLLWETSDESLATVDVMGNVTVLAAGRVTLSVSYQELTDSVEIEIIESGNFVQGKVVYQDRKYDANGFTSVFFPTYNNVRYVTVDLLDENKNILESTITNAMGRFQFGHVIPENYSIRVLAQVDIEPAPGFSVKDMDGEIYAVTKDSVVGETIYDIKILHGSSMAGVFNILDVFVSAAQYSREAFQVDVEDLSAFWEENMGLGTYFCSGYEDGFCEQGQGIYILSNPGGADSDTDEFDDDVLLHEFGHFIMENHFIDDSPAGCHTISTNDSDLSLAWSEGWGTFFGFAVKSWMDAKPEQPLSSAGISTYVDTDGSNAFLSYDIEQIDELDIAEVVEFADSYYYASGEAAVSKILWSILKNYGIEKITDVLANHFMDTTQPTNLPNFWQGLLTSNLYDEAQLPELTAIFAERKVFYQEDQFESDDTVNTANLIQVGAENAPDYYLYKDDLGNDIDVFAFDAEAGMTYRVETSELRNGIDTYIRMLDEDGSLADLNGQEVENDDAAPGDFFRFDGSQFCRASRFFNDKSSLASKLEFTTNISGRYYVEVSHLSTNFDKFGAVGPYGSYRLTVEQVQ